MPGQFLRISVQGLELPNAIVVPAKAIAEGPQGPVAYVLNEQNIARPQPVTLGTSVAQNQVIEKGLQAGERVIVSGIPKVRPGQPVRPVSPGEPTGRNAGEASQQGGATPEAGR